MDIVLQSRRVPPTLLEDYSRVNLLVEPLPHQWLFPRCSVIMCHGGSGTVSSALMSGIPLIVSPFGFDQFFWGEQVEWLGVGKHCNHVNLMGEKELYNALTCICSADVRKRVKEMAKKIKQDKGIEKAIHILTTHLKIVTSD